MSQTNSLTHAIFQKATEKELRYSKRVPTWKELGLADENNNIAVPEGTKDESSSAC